MQWVGIAAIIYLLVEYWQVILAFAILGWIIQFVQNYIWPSVVVVFEYFWAMHFLSKIMLGLLCIILINIFESLKNARRRKLERPNREPVEPTLDGGRATVSNRLPAPSTRSARRRAGSPNGSA